MREVTSELTFGVEDFAQELAKLLCWAKIPTEVILEVKWAYSDGAIQTFSDPAEPGEIEIEHAMVLWVDGNPIHSWQGESTDKLIRDNISDDVIETSLWETLDD